MNGVLKTDEKHEEKPTRRPPYTIVLGNAVASFIYKPRNTISLDVNLKKVITYDGSLDTEKR